MKYAWTSVLVFLLAILQAQLWFGRGSIPHVQSMQIMLTQQAQSNRKHSEQNERLRIEIYDLKEGLEMVEDIARHELGMVAYNEVYVQFLKP